MHSKGVIHRDLKPANILYNKNDDGNLVWKIADFGASVKQESKFLTTICKTMTPEYASIE